MISNVKDRDQIEQYRSIYQKKKFIGLKNFLHPSSADKIYKHFPHIS